MSSDQERKALLATLKDQAAELVEDHWYLIEGLAKRLLELCETSGDPFHQMSGDEVNQFLSERQTR